MKKVFKILLILLFLISLNACKSNKFTITFMDNDNVVSTIKVNKNSKSVIASAPNKQGYQFEYWTLDNEPFDFNSVIKADLTLYALYSKVYNVTLSLNDELTTQVVRENEQIVFPTVETKENMLFMGWFNGEELFDPLTFVNQDLTLSAKFIPIVKASAVSFGEKQITVGMKTVTPLKYTTTPLNSTDKAFFHSNDEQIVTVDEDGNISAHQIGKTQVVITVNGFTDIIDVNVVSDVETISCQDSITLEVNENEKINPIIYPSNALNKTLSYKIADETIAKVDENGVVTALKGGSTILTITALNNTTKEVSINVNELLLQLLIDDKVIEENEYLYFYNNKDVCSYKFALHYVNYKDGKGLSTNIDINNNDLEIKNKVDYLTIENGLIFMNQDISNQISTSIAFTYDNMTCTLNCIFEPLLKLTPTSANITINDNKWYVSTSNYLTSLESNVFGTFNIETDKAGRIDNFKAYSNACSFAYYLVKGNDETIISFVSKAGQKASIHFYNN